jgi:hypothetical protein
MNLTFILRKNKYKGQNKEGQLIQQKSNQILRSNCLEAKTLVTFRNERFWQSIFIRGFYSLC